MKTNKAWIIALAAAGAAIAGAIVFLATSKTGKKTVKKWTINGKRIAGRIDKIIKDAKKRIDHLKEEVNEKSIDDSVVNEVYE